MSRPYLAANLPPTAVVMRCPGTIGAASLSQKMLGMREQAPWHVPLFQAVLASELVIVLPLPGQAIPMAKLSTIGKPAIILLCDDGPVSEGPSGWACASHAFRWSAASIINGTGGDTKIYETGVQAVREIKRLTICDTSSSHFDDWRNCAIAEGEGYKPILGFRPPLGRHHPRVPA